MIEIEKTNAEWSIQNKRYITYVNINKNECFRIGPLSMCLCNHSFLDHYNKSDKCKSCTCQLFRFIPSRPEQCGYGHLPRRDKFNINEWKCKCICKHE